MKLNKEFIRHDMDGMTLVIPTADAGFHGVIRGNKTVDVILGCLEQGADEKQIVDALCERFEGDREIIAADAAGVISRLKEVGAIDD